MGGGKRLYISPGAYGEGQEHPHDLAGVGPWWAGERLSSGGGLEVSSLLPFSIGVEDVSSVLQVPGMSEPDRDTQAGLSPGAHPPPFFSLISTSWGSPISK